MRLAARPSRTYFFTKSSISAARTHAEKAGYDPDDFSVLIIAIEEQIQIDEECLATVEAGVSRLTALAASMNAA